MHALCLNNYDKGSLNYKGAVGEGRQIMKFKRNLELQFFSFWTVFERVFLDKWKFSVRDFNQ